MTGRESARAEAPGEEQCVESEYGPSSSWESLSKAGVDEQPAHGVRAPVFGDARDKPAVASRPGWQAGQRAQPMTSGHKRARERRKQGRKASRS